MSTPRPIRRAWAALGVLLALAPAGAAHAQGTPNAARPRFDDVRGSAQAVPNVAKLGERVTYHATLHAGGPIKIRVFTPQVPGAFHWGPLRVRADYDAKGPGVGAGAWTEGTAMGFVIEAPLQVFALGDVAVPGLLVEVDDGRGPRRMHLPSTHLAIAPLVAANDTSADLHAMRGPIAAPWWERVPWRWVALALLVIAAIVTLIVLRRRRKPVAAPAMVAPVRPRDPVADALRELEVLRRMGLPAQGKFDEHALQLTRIARRFLEAVAGHTRPGDTTPEVVQGLSTSRLDLEEVRQVEGLLRMWDRLKFARAQSSPEESARAEASVESLVRRHARPLEPPAAPAAPGTGKAA